MLGCVLGFVVAVMPANVTETLSNVTETVVVAEPLEEVWQCNGKACKLFNNEVHESGDGLSATEAGLVAGIVILGVLCVVVIVVVVVLHSKVAKLVAVRSDLEKANKARYEVKQELAHTGETIKAQDTILKSNVKELQSINGPPPPEGVSANPLANIPQEPLRSTVTDFQARLGILESELQEQRRATRHALI